MILSVLIVFSVLNVLNVFECSWADEPRWVNLGSSGLVWAHLDSSGLIWAPSPASPERYVSKGVSMSSNGFQWIPLLIRCLVMFCMPLYVLYVLYDFMCFCMFV